MSENTVYVKRYPLDREELLQVQEQEVWRYAGYRGGPDEQESSLKILLQELIRDCMPIFRYDVCYRRFPLEWNETDSLPVLPFTSESRALARCLQGSREAVMMAATIGIEADRRIARYERTDPTKALLLQAMGAERVETLCDLFCNEICREEAAAGNEITPRFSPGYGDLPLETQREFVRLLDCSRQIGISLNASLLMSPTKSVTAIFGIRPAARDRHKEVPQGCSLCAAKDCQFRRQPVQKIGAERS